MAASAGRLIALPAGFRLRRAGLLHFRFFPSRTRLGLAPLEVFPKRRREPGGFSGIGGIGLFVHEIRVSRSQTGFKLCLPRAGPLWQTLPARCDPPRDLIPVRCRSSVVEHLIGNEEVHSSILCGSTIALPVAHMPERSFAERPTQYRPDIDGLRAVAVLGVMISHAKPGTLNGGFGGVDVFFVISGFLITGNILTGLNNGRFSIADFYARRIRRLFPALLLVFGVVWIAGYAILTADDFRALGKHIAASAAFVPNIVFWHELAYSDAGTPAEMLLHLWSLGIEEQYYLLWPVALILFARSKYAALFIAALIFFSFAANLYLTFASALLESAFYLPFPRFWELLIGSLLAFAATREASKGATDSNLFLALSTSNPSQRLNEIKAWSGSVLIVAAYFAIPEDAYPGFWVLLPVIGAALLIAAGPATLMNRVLLGNRAMATIGLISYPLYLWHWPLISLTEYAAGDLPSAWQRLLVVFSAFPLAWLTYRYIESPIRYPSPEHGRTRGAAALLLAMAAVFALGLWTAYA
jgi:peptidoglycan/LPS O-acetylase OafA/YrhL